MLSFRRLSLSLFIAAAVSFSFARAEPPATTADPVVMTVNGEPVSAAEYRLVMERQVPGVYGHFKQTRNLDDHAGYWSETSGPDGPLARLRQVVCDELVRIKVHQAAARQRNLVEKTAFADFQRDFAAENARRRDALARKEVIYGPPQYREASYYYIRLGDLAYKLRQAIAKELEPGITDAAVAEFYEKNKGGKPLGEVRLKIRELLAAKEAEGQLQALVAAARVEADPDALRSLVPRVDAGVE